MSDRRWCEGCESIQPDDGFPCQRCEAQAEEAKAAAPMTPPRCGCRIELVEVPAPIPAMPNGQVDAEIVYCPLHHAAPALLTLVQDALEDVTEFETEWNKQARAIVAQAGRTG